MVDKIKIKKFINDKVLEEEDFVIKEHRANIYVNGGHYISLMCLPQSMDELAVGFLFSEGAIRSYEDVVKLDSDGMGNVYVIVKSDTPEVGKRIITSGFGKGSVNLPFLNYERLPKVISPVKISCDDVINMVKSFNLQSGLFQKTGAVHSSALVFQDGTNLFYEDIGRHNAIDKIVGKALIADLCIKEGILLTSGRISSEILIKTAKLGIPVIISISAPTNMAVEIARDINMTLIGFARGSRFNIYSGDCRVFNYCNLR